MSEKDIYILGIESSCDDTSAAVLKNDKVLSNIIANQDIHKKYGGVVPELASRAHLSNIIPTVESAIKKAKISLNQLSAISFTRGPGLMGSLIVGTEFAKALGLSLSIPVIEVNHMQAHLLVHYINNGDEVPPFPFLGVTISGGHTQFIQNLNDICASIQKNLIDNLMNKVHLLSVENNLDTIVFGGGVSANSYLKKRLEKYSNDNDLKIFIPELQFSTDNAAMIGIVGYLKYKYSLKSNLKSSPSPRLSF